MLDDVQMGVLPVHSSLERQPPMHWLLEAQMGVEPPHSELVLQPARQAPPLQISPEGHWESAVQPWQVLAMQRESGPEQSELARHSTHSLFAVLQTGVGSAQPSLLLQTHWAEMQAKPAPHSALFWQPVQRPALQKGEDEGHSLLMRHSWQVEVMRLQKGWASSHSEFEVQPGAQAPEKQSSPEGHWEFSVQGEHL